MQGEWGRWTRKRPNCDTNGSFVFQITVWLPFYRYIFPCVYQYLSSTCCLVVAVRKPKNLMIKASCRQDAACAVFKRLLVEITSLKHIQMCLKLWIAVKDRTCSIGKESYEQLENCETAKKLCSAFWMYYSLGMWQLQQPFFLFWTYADRCKPEGNTFFWLNSEHCSMEVCRIVSHFLIIMLTLMYLFFLHFWIKYWGVDKAFTFTSTPLEL